MTKELSGVWHNQYGSEMQIVVAPDGRLSGVFKTGVGLVKPSGEFELLGFAVADLVAFSVNFGRADALTAWVGHVIREGERDEIQTLWHMTYKVPGRNPSEGLWKSVWTGADVFRRGPQPRDAAKAATAAPQPLWIG